MVKYPKETVIFILLLLAVFKGASSLVRALIGNVYEGEVLHFTSDYMTVFSPLILNFDIWVYPVSF